MLVEQRYIRADFLTKQCKLHTVTHWFRSRRTLAATSLSRRGPTVKVRVMLSCDQPRTWAMGNTNVAQSAV